MTKILRKIIRIDEQKCNGCGECVPQCAEGALEIIEGKARLVRDSYCDGLGACLGHCPEDAISIEERLVEEFDQKEVVKHRDSARDVLTVGCPSCRVITPDISEDISQSRQIDSQLSQWPVQLMLVPPQAPFLKGCNLLLTADCVPFALSDFHKRFLTGHRLLVACPKLDDYKANLEKLTHILQVAKPASLTVLIMEVPCCGGLTRMARLASEKAGFDLEIEQIVIGIDGKVV
jgi:Pyruvate/2-oxoacid:ferredoxin oxidoreductase delta subunit